MNRKLFTMYLCVIALIITIGCTTAEWGRIKQDAQNDLPRVMDDLGQSGGNPASIAYIIAAYVGGLVSKSAARGFGKAGKKSTDIAKSIVQGLQKRKECEPPTE